MTIIKKLFFSLIILSSVIKPELIEIDSIRALVSSVHGTEIITQSDLDRPALSGEMRTMDKLIFEKAVLLDAKKHQMVATDDMVEGYLLQIQHDNNLTPAQMRELFVSGGYTYEEGLAQLRDMQTVNNMIQFKVSSELIVPRKEIEAYYEQNPVYEDAEFSIQRTVVPFAKDITKEEQKEIIEKHIAHSGGDGFLWNNTFTVKAEDLAADKMFITQMNVGDVSEPQAIANGFELFQLVDKKDRRLLTLDERYLSIVQSLQQPKYAVIMQKYQEDLMNSVSIVRF
jgi:hypothetical protein